MAKPKRAQNRPKNLDLTTIRLPMPALVSIMHRMSGAFLFFVLPLLLWIFQKSLAGQEGYQQVLTVFKHPLVKLFSLLVIWAFFHHACAGIRHLALDANLGLRLKYARASSRLVLLVSILLTLWVGFWFC